MRAIVKSAANTVEQWSRVQKLHGGDSMRSSTMMQRQVDTQDATHIRVSQYSFVFWYISQSSQYDVMVDIHARNRQRRSLYTVQSCYSQLQDIITITLPPIAQVNLTESQTFVLAGVRHCDTGHFTNALQTPVYERYAEYEVVDLSTLQCLVGQVKCDEKFWALLDRTGMDLSASATEII
jgi:hypothetical protein